jgi:mRNA interferase HigB
VQIITRTFLKAVTARHPRAAEALDSWVDIVRHAQWKNPIEMKRSFPNIDPVKVKSGKTVYVCNIRRDEFRLVVAVHFDRARVYTLRFLTHAEYDRNQWKQEL